MHLTKVWAFLFQDREGSDLLIERQAFAGLLIDFLVFRQQVDIEPATLFKGLIELLFLLLSRVNAILKHFMHGVIEAQTQQGVKREAALPLLPVTCNAAFIPRLKDRVFPR